LEILNIKEFTSSWKEKLKHDVWFYDIDRRIGIIGHANMPYVKGLVRDCAEIGIIAKVYDYDEDINTIDYLKLVYGAETYNDYIILQTPLPPAVDAQEIKKHMNASKDIDNFTGRSVMKANTPLGIIRYLDACGFEYEGADAVVIGRSDVVGKPMAQMLLDKDCTVTICHSKTQYLQRYGNWADLVVVAAGKPEWFFPTMMAGSAKLVVDVGINEKDGKIVGDVHPYHHGVIPVTPVPGGVGLLTRCALLEQILNN
jgi:methylenetetrahydrofolate dehydrogenase (NADP+)/methenyltetrahydrofolate cyclohydrolase